MRVELPDGTVIDDVPDGTTKSQLAEKLKANGMVVPKEWMEPAKRKTPQEMSQDSSRAELRSKAGVGEAVLNTATGAVGGIVGGYAGLVGGALPGPQGQGANWAEKTQRAMTYEPRLSEGKEIAEKLQVPGQILMKGAEMGGDMANEAFGPAAGAGTKATLAMIPALLSRGMRPLAEKGMANVSKAASRNAVSDATLSAAQKEGYVVMPETKVGGAATMVSGKQSLGHEATIRNQEVTNKIARRESGLREDEPITKGALERARDQMSAPYKEVANMGPAAKKTLDQLNQTRADARAWHRHAEQPPFHPDAMKKARDLDKKADKLEARIDSIAKGSKNPNLLAELKVARKNLAKNHEVERALNLGSGDVDARYLGYRLDSGAPLSGGLQTIARFAQGQGFKVTRDASRVPLPGGEHGNIYGSLIGAVEGGRHFGLKGALLGGGLPLLRGPARSLALSKFAQPSGPTGPGTGLKLMDIGSRPTATGAAALTPSLGLQPPREQY